VPEHPWDLVIGSLKFKCQRIEAVMLSDITKTKLFFFIKYVVKNEPCFVIKKIIKLNSILCGMAWNLPNSFHAWSTRTIFRHASAFINHGKGNTEIYVTTKLFYENNISWKKRFGFFILSIMNVGYNINIRCNKKLMFYKDRGIDFSV